MYCWLIATLPCRKTEACARTSRACAEPSSVPLSTQLEKLFLCFFDSLKPRFPTILVLSLFLIGSCQLQWRLRSHDGAMQQSSSSGVKNGPRRPALDLNSKQDLHNKNWYAGKLISHKTIKQSVIHSVLRMAWARFGKVTISEAESGILLFGFGRQEDAEKILDLSSWPINEHILKIKRWEPSGGVKDVEF